MLASLLFTFHVLYVSAVYGSMKQVNARRLLPHARRLLSTMSLDYSGIQAITDIQCMR